ncbi:MAG: response regulator [Bacteroidota bacterium]|nr:response regulator [Bacteroidota bacterium]
MPPTQKNIILYADDDPDDLELVQEAFRKYAANVDVLTATDGSQALSYLLSINDGDPSPCLIILDINMPMLSGKDVLVRLRQEERFEATPVVLFTTSSMSLDAQFAKHYNAGFITKPLDSGQMRKITEQFIRHCTEDIQKLIKRTL